MSINIASPKEITSAPQQTAARRRKPDGGPAASQHGICGVARIRLKRRSFYRETFKALGKPVPIIFP